MGCHGNSLDLNTIQTFWPVMYAKIAKKMQATKVKLKERIIRVWHHEIEYD